MVKIVAISDSHENHHNIKKMPMGDVLVHAGDCTMMGNMNKYRSFLSWFESQPHDHKVFIAGNHDWNFWNNNDESRKLAEERGIIYLQDSGWEHKGVKFWGTPWQPVFHNWAFNLTEEALLEKWKDIPNDTNILISHGPPYGHLDMNREGEYCGSKSLLSVIKRLTKLEALICGHIHEGYGTKTLPLSLPPSRAVTHAPLIVNASQAGGYKHQWQQIASAQPPIVFEVEERE